MVPDRKGVASNLLGFKDHPLSTRVFWSMYFTLHAEIAEGDVISYLGLAKVT